MFGGDAPSGLSQQLIFFLEKIILAFLGVPVVLGFTFLKFI